MYWCSVIYKFFELLWILYVRDILYDYLLIRLDIIQVVVVVKIINL